MSQHRWIHDLITFWRCYNAIRTPLAYQGRNVKGWGNDAIRRDVDSAQTRQNAILAGSRTDRTPPDTPKGGLKGNPRQRGGGKGTKPKEFSVKKYRTNHPNPASCCLQKFFRTFQEEGPPVKIPALIHSEPWCPLQFSALKNFEIIRLLYLFS